MPTLCYKTLKVVVDIEALTRFCIAETPLSEQEREQLVITLKNPHPMSEWLEYHMPYWCISLLGTFLGRFNVLHIGLSGYSKGNSITVIVADDDEIDYLNEVLYHELGHYVQSLEKSYRRRSLGLHLVSIASAIPIALVFFFLVKFLPSEMGSFVLFVELVCLLLFYRFRYNHLDFREKGAQSYEHFGRSYPVITEGK